MDNYKAKIVSLKEKEVVVNQKVTDLTNTNDSECKDYKKGWYDCLNQIKKTLDWSGQK